MAKVLQRLGSERLGAPVIDGDFCYALIA